MYLQLNAFVGSMPPSIEALSKLTVVYVDGSGSSSARKKGLAGATELKAKLSKRLGEEFTMVC